MRRGGYRYEILHIIRVFLQVSLAPSYAPFHQCSYFHNGDKVVSQQQQPRLNLGKHGGMTLTVAATGDCESDSNLSSDSARTQIILPMDIEFVDGGVRSLNVFSFL